MVATRHARIAIRNGELRFAALHNGRLLTELIEHSKDAYDGGFIISSYGSRVNQLPKSGVVISANF